MKIDISKYQDQITAIQELQLSLLQRVYADLAQSYSDMTASIIRNRDDQAIKAQKFADMCDRAYSVQVALCHNPHVVGLRHFLNNFILLRKYFIPRINAGKRD